MALANLTDLESALKDWAGDRTDLSTSRVDDCITMAEADIQNGVYDATTGFEIAPPLRVKSMETVNSAFVLSGEFNTLPTDFLEMREVWLSSQADWMPLSYTPPHTYDSLYGSTESGPPIAYSIVGAQIRVGPGASASDTLRLIYYASVPGLVANSTNWLMTRAPNVYLYGALRHLAPFIDAAPNLLGMWQAGFITGLKGLIMAEKRAHSGTAMVSRAVGVTVT
jgi:hypothetical protein